VQLSDGERLVDQGVIRDMRKRKGRLPVRTTSLTVSRSVWSCSISLSIQSDGQGLGFGQTYSSRHAGCRVPHGYPHVFFLMHHSQGRSQNSLFSWRTPSANLVPGLAAGKSILPNQRVPDVYVRYCGITGFVSPMTSEGCSGRLASAVAGPCIKFS
jgi:hypothetical protein